MNKLLLKMSRRERVYLIAGTAILLFGIVVYPATKKAKAYRTEQMELLEDEIYLLEDLHELKNNEDVIKAENKQLLKALRNADDLLFPPVSNPILTQTAMIKLLNQLGPDLAIEVTSGRSSVGDGPNQMNLSLQGEGRYAEILKFMHRLETYRPLMLVDEFTIAIKRSRRFGGRGGNRGRRGPLRQAATTPQTTTEEPTVTLRMTLLVNFQDEGEK